jgi:hypothetical protein
MVIETRETGPIETDPKTRGLKKEVAEERKLGRSPDMFRKERTRGHAEDLSGQNGPEDKRIFPGEFSCSSGNRYLLREGSSFSRYLAGENEESARYMVSKDALNNSS